MTLRVLDIPPDPQELAEWLEHQVVDFRLGELVKELTDLRGASGSLAVVARRARQF